MTFLEEKTRLSIKEVLEKWDDPEHGEDPTLPYDWQGKMRPHLRAGDVRGMRRAALPSIQARVIELAHGARNESVQLQAAQLVLAQEGQGAIQRTEHGFDYERMPVEHLKAVLGAKLSRLQQLQPSLNLQVLIDVAKANADKPADADAIPAEFEEVIEPK